MGYVQWWYFISKLGSCFDRRIIIPLRDTTAYVSAVQVHVLTVSKCLPSVDIDFAFG